MIMPTSLSLETIELSTGWRLRQADTDQWLPVHQVPTTIHADLIANKKIPDPYLDRNESLSQWVAEKTWIYETTLPPLSDLCHHEAPTPELSETDQKTTCNPIAPLSGQLQCCRRYVLDFEGLDTYVSIYLNDSLIAKSDNMWIPLRVDVTSHLDSPHKTTNHSLAIIRNTLRLEFESSRLKARELQAAHPEHNWLASNGESARVAARKAQYHWGWDWGPVQVTCGPWRPISLDIFVARIAGLEVHYELALDFASVSGTISATIEDFRPKLDDHELHVEFVVCNDPGEVVLRETVRVQEETVAVPFRVQDPTLWWPAGYGPQALYTLSATLCLARSDGTATNTAPIHTTDQKVGFRRVELIQEDDHLGQSFYFRVNDVEIFAGGANWIPAHMNLTEVTAEMYHDLLLKTRDANMVMLRVWGGGTYEPPAFYEAADELGLMIWQDFMFACGIYPCHQEFQDSVSKEAEVQVTRLRRHPSVILFCGNNEDYQVAEQEVGFQYGDEDPDSWLKGKLPARLIYENLLPDIVRRLSPNTPYHPGSPFSPPTSSSDKPSESSDPTTGDLHQWNVYHGRQTPYQSYPNQAGRFVSEFGMPSLPSLDTLRKSVSDQHELRVGSRTLDWHNKAAHGEGILASYVSDNLGPAMGSRTGSIGRFRPVGSHSLPLIDDSDAMERIDQLDRWIYATQLCQAEAMAFAFRGWRKMWSCSAQDARKGGIRHSVVKASSPDYCDPSHGLRATGGALVWQLNDVWPATSWSIIDSSLQPKPAFYTIRRALAPISLVISRTNNDWRAGHVKPSQTADYRVYITSDPRFAAGRYDKHSTQSRSARVLLTLWTSEGEESRAYDVQIPYNGTTEVVSGSISTAKDTIISARVYLDDELIAREVSWPQPLKYLTLGRVDLEVAREVVQDSSRNETEETQLRISTDKPVKGLVFSVPSGDGVWFEDNCLDVMPGDAQTVRVRGLKAEDELVWRYYTP